MSKTMSKIDLWNDVVAPSILEQYRGTTLSASDVASLGCTNRWQSCLKSIVDKIQQLDDAACELPGVIDFSTAPVGEHLDWLVSLINKTRKENESDADLFARFISSLGRGRAGSTPFVIDAAAKLSVDDDPVYFEENYATFFIYTPNGKQIARGYLRSISPGGVLALPGAAMTDGEGNLIRDYNGNVMMAVAKDAAIGKV